MRQSLGARARGVAVLCALGIALTACAPPFDATWQPPQRAGQSGAHLVTTAPGPEGNEDDAPSEADGAPNEAEDSAADSAAELGLRAGRIRNDALPIQARYLLVPGQEKLNERVTSLLWSAIRASGKSYAPQVFPVGAGLGDRGCVSGSTEWSAAAVLADASIGPHGGKGTAITCSFLGAAGDYLGVRYRTVVGAVTTAKESAPAAKVTSDTTETWFVNVRSGEILDRENRWTADAAPALWRAVVTELREQSGTLSNVDVADPPPAQIALASQALNTAVATGSGVRLMLPAGIAAPELEALGTAATTTPTTVEVPRSTLAEWSTAAERARIEASDTPFVGLGASPAATPIDCALVPCVALTYDDGPSTHTAALLDTLEKHHAPATFFLLGSQASASPDLVRRMRDLGCETGSHTMTHPDLTTLEIPDAVAQITDAANVISGITGQPVTMFRPPYGAINNKILRAVKMPAVLWSVDTNDWQDPGQDALVQRSVPELKPGGIVLFHDTHPDSVAVAERVIEGLRDRGFTLATVSQLFGGSVPEGRVFAR